MEAPSPESIKTQRARFYFERGQYPECLEQATEALATDPTEPEALFLAGMAALLDDKPALAKQFASSLLQEDPESSSAHFLMGHCRQKVDLDPYRAEEHFRNTLKLDPDVPEYYANLGTFLANRGRIEEGITVARKGLRLAPENSTVLQSLQGLYRLNKEEALANEFAERALAVNPESSASHLEAGLSLLGKGEKREASNRFLETLRLDPSDQESVTMIATEKVFALPLYKKRFILSLKPGFLIAACSSPLLWWLAAILFRPFIVIFWISLALLILGLLHSCGFYFLRWHFRRQIMRGRV